MGFFPVNDFIPQPPPFKNVQNYFVLSVQNWYRSLSACIMEFIDGKEFTVQ